MPGQWPAAAGINLSKLCRQPAFPRESREAWKKQNNMRLTPMTPRADSGHATAFAALGLNAPLRIPPRPDFLPYAMSNCSEVDGATPTCARQYDLDEIAAALEQRYRDGSSTGRFG
jgi:hypothetical protein